MIVACHACPSQYSVPDAKVRGKKVRITCKHCGAAIVVDGLSMLADVIAPSPPPKFQPPRPLSVPSLDSVRQEEQTLIARPKFGENVSVHDEPTVIGQIPREALEFERASFQRAQPAPAVVAATPAVSAPAALASAAAPVAASEPPLPRFDSSRPAALPETPESPADETKRASPRAFARSEPPAPIVTTPVPPLQPSVPPAPPPALPTVMIKDTRDEPTLVSRSLPRSRSPKARAPQRSRSHMARVALALLAVVLVSFLILKLR